MSASLGPFDLHMLIICWCCLHSVRHLSSTSQPHAEQWGAAWRAQRPPVSTGGLLANGCPPLSTGNIVILGVSLVVYCDGGSEHQCDDSRIGCGFLESPGSMTLIMLWNLVKLTGASWIGVNDCRCSVVGSCLASSMMIPATQVSSAADSC